ncbi:MAG: class I SAM-dependent methyltransferase [Phycisphaerales bacterium]|nr:MAG: class I SAM-dependent methyltransferase [Phycisphaerales bacterium]
MAQVENERPPVEVLSKPSADEKSADKLVEKLGPQLKQLVYNTRARRGFNAHGVHVVPANFYSVIPTFDDIERSYEYDGSPAPYDDRKVFDLDRLDATLAAMMPFAAEFEPAQSGSVERPKGYFWNNPAFSYSDAMSYYAFVRLWKPKLVLEIGSGFSTLVASAAAERNRAEGVETRIVCIEPYPKPWLAEIPHVAEVIERPAQSFDADWFNERLGDGDVFFIDSTHVVKTGSDCAHLYLRILPNLRRHILLHAHDIFLPYGYPRAWLEEKSIFWNEQYILYALLHGNPSLRVLFGSAIMRHHRMDALTSFMHGRSQPGGGSLWFEHVPA